MRKEKLVIVWLRLINVWTNVGSQQTFIQNSEKLISFPILAEKTPNYLAQQKKFKV